MREITIPAGQRTLVYRRRFSSIPQEIEFTSSSAGGTVERVGSRWILGRTHREQPLAVANRVRKGYWDTFFEVFVTPAQPVVVTVPRPRMRGVLLIAALVVLVVAIAVVIAMAGR
jgi:hypothetical protein